jgi:ABC-type nitrate/sulfonate/bicarbonate transport system substrate-binding protein
MRHLLGIQIGAALVGLALLAPAHAQEKLKIGSSVQDSPFYYLPVGAAQDQGFFKKHGLDVEWVPSKSGSDLERAFAADAIKIGLSSAGADIVGITRGVPVSVIATLVPDDDFTVWAAANGKIKKPEDLKGAKIGVARFGGLEHSYAQLAASKLGLANDVQYVSTGGINESLAALISGTIDAVVLPVSNLVKLELEGKVREVVAVKQFLTQPSITFTITARKDFIASQPETVKKVVASILEANRFIMSEQGKPWALKKIEEAQSVSKEGAERIYKTVNFSQDGKLQAAALDNVVKFLVDYKILKTDKPLTAAEIMDDRFVK